METTLRVVSFNIRTGLALDGWHSWPLRRRTTARAIAELDADLIGLQEAHGFQLRYLCRHLPDYQAVGVGRTDGRQRGERCALLCRRDRLSVVWFTTRWLSPTPQHPGSRGWGCAHPRVATLARVHDQRTRRLFGVLDTHWDDASPEARRHSAALVSTWLEPDVPWILTGDLNATVESDAVHLLLAAGLSDALKATPSRGPGAGTHHGFTGAEDRTRIDHILLSPGWRVLEAGIRHPRPGGRLPSDHWPVVASVAPV